MRGHSIFIIIHDMKLLGSIDNKSDSKKIVDNERLISLLAQHPSHDCRASLLLCELFVKKRTRSKKKWKLTSRDLCVCLF